ncbi:DUF5801 repeats-in-toxin domain-containing protein, partial [Croceicoccus gelatinilyticus]|uniref:DUF5801 repeats-in-toxin domain-containing protein n=1 Tax=Croceicoccus gelatinilyticus TaxID=2835536 RepID=UPI001BCEDC07
NGGADTAFTVEINDDGTLTVTQYAALEHTDATDDNDTLDLAGLIDATVTITDNDGDTDSGTVAVGAAVTFYDDGPAVTNATAIVDDDGLTVAADDSALGDDVGGSGGDQTLFEGTLDVSFGADGGSVSFFDDMNGETAVIGQETVTYYFNGGVLYAEITTSDDATRLNTDLFSVTLDEANGDFAVQLLQNVLHTDDGTDTENNASATLDFTATDNDGDTASGTLQISFDDDIPVFEAKTAAYRTDPDNAPNTFVGDFEYSIGADSYNTYDTAENFEIDLTAFSGTVGGGAILIDDSTYADGIQFVSASATTEVYNIYFSYAPNPGEPQTGDNDVATFATVTFDKANGEYSVVLDAPIQSYSIDTVQSDSTIAFYNSPGNPFNGAGQFEIANAAFDSDFYAQFTSVYNNLALAADGQFTGQLGYVAISSTAIGVNGNAIQPGEMLDFMFYNADPGGQPGATDALTTAVGTYFLLDQYNGEDVVVVLKIADPADPSNYQSVSLIVDAADIFTPGDDAGAPYPTLTGNQALIVIEQDDYINLDGIPDNYQIVGVQLVTSTEGLSGTAYEFNGDLNAFDNDPTSFTTANNSRTNDQDVIKILDIGVIRETENSESLSLDLDVTVTDSDGDSFNQTLFVNPAVVPPVVLDLDGDGVELVGLDASEMYDYGNGAVHTAWVGGEDGILFHDTDGNGAVSGAEEFVFGSDGVTDLAAIAAEYDSNEDGVLSGAELNDFGVWMADGSVATVESLGITEISLTTDSQGYRAADGDAIVFGEGSFVMDGEEHVLADVGFATSEYEGELSDSQVRQAEAALLAAAVPGLLVSAALDTTPLFDAPEMVNFEPTDIDFAMAVNAITPVDVELSHVSPMANMPELTETGAMPESSNHFSDDAASASRSTFNAANDAPKMDAADLGQSSEAGADFGGASHAASGGVSGDVLEALLNIGVPAGDDSEGVQGNGAMDAVRVALQEVTATDDISALVNHVVDNAPETAQHGPVGTEIMEALLNSGVAGHHFQMAALPDGADDAANLAVAAA